jgi:membrane protein HdeD
MFSYEKNHVYGGIKMNEGRHVLMGILGISLGLIVIIFPLISIFTVNAIAGIGIILVGIWILIQSFRRDSLAAGVAGLIVAVFAIMMGIVFIGDIKAFEFFSFIALYIVGFIIALTGIESLISGKGLEGKGIGALGIIIGILFVVMGTFVGNPFVLAALIGAFLIIAGIIELFEPQMIPESIKGNE